MSAYTDADVRAARDAIKERALKRFAADVFTEDAHDWLSGFSARAALDAVAPAIAARALREFADNHVHFQTAGRMAEDLYARADEIERGAS